MGAVSYPALGNSWNTKHNSKLSPTEKINGKLK